MKFIVGYQLTEDENFVRSIIENKDKIKEVYFSFGDFPNGRASVPFSLFVGVDGFEPPTLCL